MQKQTRPSRRRVWGGVFACVGKKMENDFDGNGLHIVHDGDTLMGIALKYNVNLNNLKRLNNLDSTVLYPGQVDLNQSVHSHLIPLLGVKD
jgi:hypothetical protein